MIIIKVLNNNTAVIWGRDKKEIIVMGKGICYKKRPGDYISDMDVEKEFTLSTDLNKKLQELLTYIPEDYLQAADEIIQYAKEKLGHDISDSIYISLSDHLAMSVKRFEEGISAPNTMLHEIKRFYKVEYEIGLYALDVVERNFHVRLPDEEAGFVASHILNADQNSPDSRLVNQTAGLIEQIITIISNCFGDILNEESVFYDRLIAHLKFFTYRVFSGEEHTNDDIEDLFEVMKEKFPDVYNCVEEICSYIEEKHAFSVSIDEKTYLTIHIAHILKESRRRRNQ